MQIIIKHGIRMPIIDLRHEYFYFIAFNLQISLSDIR